MHTYIHAHTCARVFVCVCVVLSIFKTLLFSFDHLSGVVTSNSNASIYLAPAIPMPLLSGK